MPGQQVKMRPLRTVQAHGNVHSLQHEYHTELFMHSLGMFNEVLCCVSCIFFFEFMPKPIYVTGIILWIFSCVLGAGLSIYHMVEYRMAKSKYKGEVRHEMLELTLYLLCYLLFLIGSVLYIPQLYSTQETLMWGHAIAGWLWIWGSIALVIAGHWNAVGVIEESTKLPADRRSVMLRRTASVALSCTAIGAAMFFAGSFLFRPGFKNECESPEAFVPVETVQAVAEEVGRRMKRRSKRFAHIIEPDLLPAAKAKGRIGAGPLGLPEAAPNGYELNTWCVSIIEQGTLLFLIGCLAFLVNSLLSTACSMMLHKIRLEEISMETENGKRPSWVGHAPETPKTPEKGQGSLVRKEEAEMPANPALDLPEKGQGSALP
mmetsp:Transcript_141558/g.440058  ORF Transcript_141558/g.440058 Transcript_141558/m.440058 type:complete len:375 (-) Transcript_141558:63-1187(-)